MTVCPPCCPLAPCRPPSALKHLANECQSGGLQSTNAGPQSAWIMQMSSATTRLFIKSQIFIFLLLHFFCLIVFTKTKCVHYICLRPFYLNDWILSVKSMDILYFPQRFPQSNEKVVSTWTTCLHLLFRFLNHSLSWITKEWQCVFTKLN